MVLYALLAFAILIALVVGQFRIASRALHERKAGMGRFTYSFEKSPIAFMLVLILEWVGLAFVFAYLLAVVVGGLFP